MSRRQWAWLLQAVLVVAVAAFVWRSAAMHWQAFRSLRIEVHVRVGPVLVAVLVVWMTYGVLIGAWRQILLGWAQPMPYRSAARIWCLANLGRYLPGKVWSVAGLAILAERAGANGWAAAASAVAMQALAVGAGGVVVALSAPNAATAIQLAVAVVVGCVTIVTLVWEPMGVRLVRAMFPSIEMHALPVKTAVLASFATAASWIGYGLAFWLLASGLGLQALPPGIAIGVFAAGYIVGLLAIFAPGGVGVRELMFMALLAPTIGSGGALMLSVASRLLLTFTEVGAALLALVLDRRTREGLH